MAIEHNEGMARPRLPRADDLPAVIPAPSVTGGGAPGTNRDAAGRFQPGNQVASGRSLRLAVRRMLGSADASNETVASVAQDAHRIYQAALQRLPDDSAPVCQLVALHARHAALAAFYSGRCAELGLLSPEALAMGALGVTHGQRAERTLVTALDVACRLAKGRPAEIDLDAINAEAEAEVQAQREAETAALAAQKQDGGE